MRRSERSDVLAFACVPPTIVFMAVDRRTMLRVGALLVVLAAIGFVVALTDVGEEPDARPAARQRRGVGELVAAVS